jgi:hypothetical protein
MTPCRRGIGDHHQVRRPGQTARGEVLSGEGIRWPFGQHRIDQPLAVRARCRADGERHWPQAQVEQTVAAPGLQVVVALWRGLPDEADLSVVQTEPLIGRPALRFDGALIGKEQTLRAGFDQHRGDGAIDHISKALGRKQNAHVLFAKDLKPLTDTGGKQRVVEVYPLRVTGTLTLWPEFGQRQLLWCDTLMALDKIDLEDLKDIIRRFAATHESP